MEDFVRAFVAFFAIIDPLGNVLVFHIFMRGVGFVAKAVAALIAVLAAFLMLLAFSFGGDSVLEFLGISQESFQIAAGLLLLPPAYRLVMEGQPFGVGAADSQKPIDLALVPLATPMIAGPGALATTIAFTDTYGLDVTVVAFGAVLAASLVAFVLADLLFKVAGEPLLRLLGRVVGVLLFAIAVDLVLDGTKAFFEI